MKETVSANIGAEAFTIDCDAYQVLKSYLDDIRSRLPRYDTETINDIESRIAEIFRERIFSPMQVVTLDMVQAAMRRMGSPADFGERQTSTPDDAAFEEPAPRKLYRSRTSRMFAGICGGLGKYTGSDPTVIRLLVVLMALFGGFSIWVYIILWIVIPEEPTRVFNINNEKKL